MGELKPTDIAWLRDQKEGGHCGEAGSDMSDYQNEAQEVVDAIDQALSSQGRHEGGEG